MALIMDLQKEQNEHALSGTRVYSVWAAMHQRCYNKRAMHFARYGGRGIKVCARWRSVWAFLEDMGHPPEGCSIDRINNDGDYELSNCRWATQEQQNENTSRNKYVEYNGKCKTIKQWAKEYDLQPRRVSERLRRGWSIEKTLTTPAPIGYEEGRRMQNKRARELWAQRGGQYRANCLAKKTPEQ
jgi:hypothetical protein